MKNVLDFILSFVLPKKMIRYRNINFFLIVLILLGCAFLCAGGSNLSLDNYVKRNKESFRLYDEIYDLRSEKTVKLPKFTISSETGCLTNFTIGEETDNVYELSFDLEDNKTLNLTLVYEPNVYVNDDEKTPHDDRILNFDLNGYYRHEPKKDENGELLEQDLLFIITNELVYYIFNHGVDLVANADGTYNRYLEYTGWSIMENKHYLPKDATEIFYTDAENSVLDYSKWTVLAKPGETKVVGDKTYTAYDSGEVAYYLPANQEEADAINAYGDPDVTKWTRVVDKADELVYIGGKEYKSQARINSNLHEVFVSSEGTTRVGVYSLYTAYNLGIELGDLGNGVSSIDPALMVEAIGNLMVSSGASQLEYYNFFYAVIFIFFMPLLWTFATWVMSRKYGELTRFKEYYAICAISFIVPTILTTILAMTLQPYCYIAQYAMFVQVAFYIFCIYKMNGINKKNPKNQNNNNTDKKEEKVIDLKVNPTPVQEKVSRTAQME
ncbi:MAG: YIP1 family protein [Bacilli bacterium]|nr:YIP1 family protein [Bacilli bacterium]